MKAHTEGRNELQMTGLEKCCGVVLSIVALYWVGAIGAAIWTVCMRNKARESLGIVRADGFCENCKVFCCYPCAICQQERELKAKTVMGAGGMAPPAQRAPGQY
jgi:Cys-rich protein (TIGR01571 family)